MSQKSTEFEGNARESENGELSYPDGSRIKNALVELGHAVSKSELNIASRRHIEMFWDLVGKM